MMANRERPSGRVLRVTVCLVLTALAAVGCDESKGQAPGNERARLVLDVLVEIDRVLQSGFGAEVAKLDLAMTQLLPKAECPGLLLAKASFETERMDGKSMADLLRSQAVTSAIHWRSSKAKSSSADFDDGQPAREVAEKIVQAMLAVSPTDNQKLVLAQVEAERLSDGCLYEEYQRAVGAGEVRWNEFLTKYARSNGDRIAALVKNVALKQLFDARGGLATRLAEARRARPDATAARNKAIEIQRKVATPELLASREGLAAAIKSVPTTLR